MLRLNGKEVNNMRRFFYKTPDGTIFESITTAENMQNQEVWVVLKNIKTNNKYTMPQCDLAKQHIVDGAPVRDYTQLTDEETIALVDELSTLQQHIGFDVDHRAFDKRCAPQTYNPRRDV